MVIRTTIQVDVSVAIRAPLEKVFELYADYENWTKVRPDVFRSVRLLRKENNEQVLEVQDMRGMHREVLRVFDSRIENEGNSSTGGVKFKETHLYEPLSDGTKHSVAIHLSYRGYHTKNALRKRVTETMQKGLEIEKEFAESQHQVP